MSKGILILAKNNEKIDYVKQAKVCATLAKYYLGNIPVCLVTDKEISDPVFDVVKLFNFTKQQRRFHDYTHAPEELSWFNLGKVDAYELSPFTETLLLDTDYFIQNNLLGLVWGSNQEILMNKNYCSIYDPTYQADEIYIGRWGPYMYWGTVIYFRKSQRCKIFFDLAKHIQEDYDFYSRSYNLPGKAIRNDYILSIAAHLSGEIFPLPVPKILNAYETDQILQINKGSILFGCDRKCEGQIYAVRIKDTNVHIMNKISFGGFANRFLEIYND